MLINLSAKMLFTFKPFIPSGSIPDSNSRVLTRDLIDRYVSDLSGKLSYLATSAQVGLVYNGVKHLEPKMMLDWGSNVCLVDDG